MKKEFEYAGYKLSYDNKILQYAKIRRIFDDFVLDFYEKKEDIWPERFCSMMHLNISYWECMRESLKNAFQYCMHEFKGIGIEITEEEFWACCTQYMETQAVLSEVFRDEYAIRRSSSEKQDNIDRSDLNETYAKGYGIGLKGAVAAYVTTEVINASINLYKQKKVQDKVKRIRQDEKNQIDALVQNEEFYDTFLYAVGESVFNMQYAYIDVLKDKKNLPINYIPREDSDKTIEILDRIKDERMGKKDGIPLIIEALSLDPFNDEVYIYAIERYGDQKRELERMGKYFGLDLRTEKELIAEYTYSQIDKDDPHREEKEAAYKRLIAKIGWEEESEADCETEKFVKIEDSLYRLESYEDKEFYILDNDNEHMQLMDLDEYISDTIYDTIKKTYKKYFEKGNENICLKEKDYDREAYILTCRYTEGQEFNFLLTGESICRIVGTGKDYMSRRIVTGDMMYYRDICDIKVYKNAILLNNHYPIYMDPDSFSSKILSDFIYEIISTTHQLYRMMIARFYDVYKYWDDEGIRSCIEIKEYYYNNFCLSTEREVYNKVPGALMTYRECDVEGLARLNKLVHEIKQSRDITIHNPIWWTNNNSDGYDEYIGCLDRNIYRVSDGKIIPLSEVKSFHAVIGEGVELATKQGDSYFLIESKNSYKEVALVNTVKFLNNIYSYLDTGKFFKYEYRDIAVATTKMFYEKASIEHKIRNRDESVSDEFREHFYLCMLGDFCKSNLKQIEFEEDEYPVLLIRYDEESEWSCIYTNKNIYLDGEKLVEGWNEEHLLCFDDADMDGTHFSINVEDELHYLFSTYEDCSWDLLTDINHYLKTMYHISQDKSTESNKVLTLYSDHNAEEVIQLQNAYKEAVLILKDENTSIDNIESCIEQLSAQYPKKMASEVAVLLERYKYVIKRKEIMDCIDNEWNDSMDTMGEDQLMQIENKVKPYLDDNEVADDVKMFLEDIKERRNAIKKEVEERKKKEAEELKRKKEEEERRKVEEELNALTEGYLTMSEVELEKTLQKLEEYTKKDVSDLIANIKKTLEEKRKERILNEIKELADGCQEKDEKELKEIIQKLKKYPDEFVLQPIQDLEKMIEDKVVERECKEVEAICKGWENVEKAALQSTIKKLEKNYKGFSLAEEYVRKMTDRCCQLDIAALEEMTANLENLDCNALRNRYQKIVQDYSAAVGKKYSNIVMQALEKKEKMQLEELIDNLQEMSREDLELRKKQIQEGGYLKNNTEIYTEKIESQVTKIDMERVSNIVGDIEKRSYWELAEIYNSIIEIKNIGENIKNETLAHIREYALQKGDDIAKQIHGNVQEFCRMNNYDIQGFDFRLSKDLASLGNAIMTQMAWNESPILLHTIPGIVGSGSKLVITSQRLICVGKTTIITPLGNIEGFVTKSKFLGDELSAITKNGYAQPLPFKAVGMQSNYMGQVLTVLLNQIKWSEFGKGQMEPIANPIAQMPVEKAIDVVQPESQDQETVVNNVSETEHMEGKKRGLMEMIDYVNQLPLLSRGTMVGTMHPKFYKRATNAIKAYALGVRVEEIFALYDDTILGSGKEGFVMTLEGMRLLKSFSVPYRCSYSDITGFEIIYDEKSKLTRLKLLVKAGSYVISDSLGKEGSEALANRISNIVKHLLCLEDVPYTIKK